MRATGRKNIENVIAYMGLHGFYTHRCYSHHRYVGGLADHSWQTYEMAMAMAENDKNIDKDSLAISALLHDFCKCGGMHDIHGHGGRSARMIQRLGVWLSGDEYLAIRFHMSLHNKTTHPLYTKANACSYRRYVNLADGMSAHTAR